MELTVVPVVKPDAANFIFGQSHFIKTVEDLHEALVGAVPGIRFGLAFCEASGKRLVRWSGNDEAALALARDNALAIGAGHTFLIFLGDGFFPVNVLAAVRAVPEVCRIYCATANPTQVIVAQTELGRGVLGVVDGASPLGVETDADIAWRKDLLRKLGYKLYEAEVDRPHRQHRRAQCSQLDRQTPRLVHGYRGRERRVLPSEPGEL
jgi:adenosine/AMP kinase